MPMVHMIIELFAFFAKILSAPFETKLADLIQDLPDAKIILNILNLSKKEMNMTLGELFKYQMNMPESFLQKQFNFIARLRVFYEEIRQNNAIILQIMLKEDRDNYFAELALAYMLEMAMLYDTLDLQSEAERLAHIQKMIDNYLNQLQSLYNIQNQIHSIDLQLQAISSRIQEIDHKLDQLAEKNFAITIDKYKHNQEILINNLTSQLQQIDSQINVHNTKLSQAEKDLALLKERNEPENIIQEKINEINGLKTVISSLEDIKKDNTTLLDKARVDLHSATELFNNGLASFGDPNDSKITKLTNIQSVLENKNIDTVSLTENIREKAVDIQKSYSDVVDKGLNDIVEQAKVLHESATANKDKFKSENQEFHKDILHLEEERKAAKIEVEKLQEKRTQCTSKIDLIDKNLKSIHPEVKAELKKAGIPVETMNLGDLKNIVESRIMQPAIPINQKSEKPWPPSSFSQTDLKLQQLLQKRSLSPKNSNDPPKPRDINDPPEPPKNGFRHK